MNNRLLSFLCFMILLCSCDKDTLRDETNVPEYSDKPAQVVKQVYLLSIHPLHNAQRVFELYQPLVEIMNRGVDDYTIQLEAAVDYADFEKKLYARHYHFALPNPLQSLEATQHGYNIFGKVTDDSQFRGTILVRKDSQIKDVKDIKGLKVSYPAHTALAACIMPQQFFHENGINVLTDITNVFVGSQESSIANVATGNVDIGVTWPPPWRGFQKNNPELASKLKVMWETPSLVNNGLVVRDDVPRDVLLHVADVFFSLSKSDEGKQILSGIEYSGFESADLETYKLVDEFLKNFNSKVRRLDNP